MNHVGGSRHGKFPIGSKPSRYGQIIRVALDYDIIAYGRQYGANFLQVPKHLGAEFRTSKIEHDHILGNEDQPFIFIHQGKLVLKIVFFDKTHKLFS